MSKIIQSGRFLSALLGKFAGPFMKVVSLNKNVLAPLATMASASVIDGAIREKILERRVVTGRKGFTLVISDVITIIKSVENLGVLIHGVSKTLKYKIKKQEGGYLGMLLGTLIASMLENMFTRNGAMRTGEGVMRAGRAIIIWIIWIKSFSSTPFFNNIQITKYFNYKPRFNGVYSRDSLPRIKDGA